MNPAIKIAVSEGKEITENITDNINEDNELEIINCFSRVSSFFDDSEFNSSDSENKVDSLLKQKFRFGSVSGLVKDKMIIKTHSSPNLLLENERVHVCIGISSLVQKSRKMQLEISAMNEINSKGNQNTASLNSCQKCVNLDNVSCSNSNRNHRCDRQRTNNTNSLAIYAAQENNRISRNLHRSRDINNNDAGCRHFNSYLRRAPFKLQDCFQDQGFLSLLACISYTIVLMIVFCLLGFILDSLKSVIGTQNLKDIRANIAQSRRTRTTMASG